MTAEREIAALPTDAETLADRISREHISRGDAIKLLVEMVNTLRTRNAALLRYIARWGGEFDGTATIIRIDDSAYPVSLLVWRGEGGELRSIEV